MFWLSHLSFFSFLIISFFFSPRVLSEGYAQRNLASTNCPVSFPKIRSAVVYQSVEAPQIEPINRQNRPFDNYDLVMEKPAGLLIELSSRNIDRNAVFKLDFYIGGSQTLYGTCFHRPFKKEMTVKNKDFCTFNKNDLKSRNEGVYKFLTLPMQEDFLKKEKEFKINVSIYPIEAYKKNKNCLKQKTIKINIKKTPNLNLGFTRIKPDLCRYANSSSQIVQKFVSSEEVREFIPAMFPIVKLYSSKLIHNGEDYIEGVCNNRFAEKKNRSIGLLEDVDALEIARLRAKYDKLIVIVPNDYFIFHQQQKSSGFTITPHWKYWKYYWFFGYHYFKSGFFGGSWNIAFVKDDQLNRGTVAHELAHTLGQGKEQYFKEDDNKIETTEYCQQFKADHPELCDTYTIPRTLDVRTKKGITFWQFVKNSWSIMNNEDTIREQWIDRDTYQKIFSSLVRFGSVISNTTELHGTKIVDYPKQKISSKVIFSGFYHKEKDIFILPKQRFLKTDIVTPSVPLELYQIDISPAFNKGEEALEKGSLNQKIPYITFQLKEVLKNGSIKIYKEIKRPVFEMLITSLHQDKNSETKAFEFSHAMASFNLPKESQKKKFQIDVLNQNGTVIYSTPLNTKNQTEDEK